MNWLVSLHRGIFYVGKRAPGNLAKLIVLSLCRPVFHAHDLLFKIVYAIGTRRLSLLRKQQRVLGLNDMAGQGEFEFGNLVRLQNAIDGLHEISRCLKAGKSSCDLSDHVPPSIRPWSPSRAKD